MCKDENFFEVCGKVRKLRQSNILPPPIRIFQFGVVVQKIRTNTYTRTIGALPLKFTYPIWIVYYYYDYYDYSTYMRTFSTIS